MKSKKYNLGSFVKTNSSGISGAAGLASGVLGMGQSNYSVDTGLDIGQGVLSGIGAGAAFGPIGMGVGALVGGVSGLISSGAKRRKLEGLRKTAINNSNSAVISNMTTLNPEMYGNSYADGGTIMPIDSTGRKPIKMDRNLNAIVVQNKDGQYFNNGTMTQSLIPMSDKARGVSNYYTPSHWQQQNLSIPTQKKSNTYYKDGGVINSEQNKINIEKGELLIDPETGKILQEYDGINPLTGGKYQPHSKGKDPKHNFTMADPGLFVISKPNAKVYKDAIESNDKLSQKTILMNIQNNKIEENGGLEKMAGGGQIGDPTGQSATGYMNIPLWNPNQPRVPGPYVPQLQAQSTTIGDLNLGANTNQLVSQQQVNPATIAPRAVSSTNSGGTNGILDAIGNYGVPALNIARGLFDSPNLQQHTTAINNPYRNQILANLPKNINLNPMINQVRQGERIATQDLRNNVNNSAVYRANRQQIGSNSAKQIADLQMQEQLANNNIAGQRAGIYGNLANQDMNEQARVREYNLNIDAANNQVRGNQQNILNTGLSQLQQVYQNNKTNKRKQQMDQYSLDILNQIYPLTKYYNAFSSNYLK